MSTSAAASATSSMPLTSTAPTLSSNPAKPKNPLEALQQAIINFVASDTKIRASLTDAVNNSSKSNGTAVFSGTAVQNPYAELHNRVRSAISSTDVFSADFTERLMSELVGEFDANAPILIAKAANALHTSYLSSAMSSNSPSPSASSPSSNTETAAKEKSFLSVNGQTDGRSSPLPPLPSTASAAVTKPPVIPMPRRLSKTENSKGLSLTVPSANGSPHTTVNAPFTFKKRGSVSGSPFVPTSAGTNSTTITINLPPTTE